MNLHGAVRGLVGAVNPDIQAVFRRSNGSTLGLSGKRTPVYYTAQPVTIQVQALSGREIEHLSNMNIQGVLRSVHMYGNTQGVVRPTQQGGDLLQFAQTVHGRKQTWLVVQVLETWPDWSRVAVCLQQ